MDNFKRILDVLNDLIKINKDREAGYVKATRELTPAEHNLRGVFERKALESRNNVVQLEQKLEEIRTRLENDAPEDGAADMRNEKSEIGNEESEILNFFQNVRNFFTGTDKPSLIKSCSDGEASIIKCYDDALNEPRIPDDVVELLREQKRTLDESEDLRSFI